MELSLHHLKRFLCLTLPPCRMPLHQCHRLQVSLQHPCHHPYQAVQTSLHQRLRACPPSPYCRSYPRSYPMVRTPRTVRH